MKKVFGILLALALFFAPFSVCAAPTVYFTAVNEMLLELADETMPFWSNGVFYVPSTVFETRKSTISSDGSVKTELGIFYSYNAEKKTAMLLRQRSGLIFDLDAGTIENNNTHEYITGAAIARGGVIFFPIGIVAQFFNLSWSSTKVEHGYLIRVKNGEASLSDKMFTEAAESPMNYRYAQYEKKQSASTKPIVQEPHEEDSPADSGRSTMACLCVRLTSETDAGKVLNAVAAANRRVAFLWDGQSELDDLLRRIVGCGDVVVLSVDATASPEAALKQIKQMNGALWSAANTKTRFVWLQNAEETVISAVAAAGYCPLRFSADLQTTTNVARLAERTVIAAQRSSRAAVLLGEDTKLSPRMAVLLSTLKELNCNAVRLREG